MHPRTVFRIRFKICISFSPSQENSSILEMTATASSVSPEPSRRRREFCHFTDPPSPSILKRLLKGEGGAAES